MKTGTSSYQSLINLYILKNSGTEGLGKGVRDALILLKARTFTYIHIDKQISIDIHLNGLIHQFVFTHTHLTHQPPLPPKQTLPQVWVAQRESLAAPDALSGFALACLLTYLLQERRLNLR